MTIYLHHNDLENDLDIKGEIAVDTESMGLNPLKDRLCLIQLSAGDGNCHLVQFTENNDYRAPRLRKLLKDSSITKIFHYARADLAMIRQYLGIQCKPVYCTKIASKLTRTYTERHSLKELCSHLLKIDLVKQETSSDWGAPLLTDNQKLYAASDVLYLHQLKLILDNMLIREKRHHIANAYFQFLETVTEMDLCNWDPCHILTH